MAWKIFKKKPAARIKIGDTFLGTSISATAEGYVIYKEWDAEDRTNYYWEEWELRGFNNYDSFIEFDHYTRKITLYEPLKPQELIDPLTLKKGQIIQFTSRYNQKHTATVREVGTGIVARREGTFTYHIYEGDKVSYAECGDANNVSYSIEKYNDKEFDIYKASTINRKEQKQLLGRVVAPGLWGHFKALPLSTKLILPFMIGFIFIPMIISAVPRYNTFCTPRTVTPSRQTQTITSPTTLSPRSTTVIPTDELVSQDTDKSCYRRRIYSGGGGGVGK